MSYFEVRCPNCRGLFAGEQWDVEVALASHKAQCRGKPTGAVRPVQQPAAPQRARDSRQQLRALLPETVSESWLNAWLIDNPRATLPDACKAILHQSNREKQETEALLAAVKRQNEKRR